ncbi:MAG: hypothetical protein ACP5UQ_08480 [Anaerolineae bacterium]
MSEASHRLVWALRGTALALIALSLAAPLFPEEVAWGLWPATYVPTPWRWVLAALAAGLALFGDRLPFDRLRLPPLAVGRRRVAIALACAVPFYLFRLRHLRWGDAYILVHAIPDPQVRLTYNWQAPLDVFIHARLWALGNRLFGWPDPIPVYTLLSVTAGILFIWVLLGLAGWLAVERREQAVIFGLVASLGLIQLFFGYIENYSLMAVGVLVFIWLALRTLRGEVALFWTALALALTHAFHPSTIALAPGLLFLAWQLARAAPVKARPLRLALSIAMPYLAVFAGVVILMTAGGHGLDALLGADAPGGGDHRWFVPLFETTTRWEHYTMFSRGHLLDIVNEQLLVAPVVWPGLILCALFARSRLPHRDPLCRQLFVLALLYALLTWTWNPDYGGQRDWDLFAPASLPAALLLAQVLRAALPEPVALRRAGWALIAAQAFHTALWVYQNTLPWTWQ